MLPDAELDAFNHCKIKTFPLEILYVELNDKVVGFILGDTKIVKRINANHLQQM